MSAFCSKLFVAAGVLLVISLFAGYHLQVGSAQVSGGTIVKVQPSETEVRVGDTLSVSVIVESVDNLYGLDVTLMWDESVLQFQAVDLRLGVESHPDGILHEDSGSDIYVADNNASKSEYHLAATSVGPASSFNGSGTVFRIEFKAIAYGISPLSLETELADHPLPGDTANLIQHNAVDGSVESAEGSSNGSGRDELFMIALIAVGVIVAVVAVILFVYSRKR